MTTSNHSPILARPFGAARCWYGEARGSRIRVAGLTVMTTRAVRACERNALELGGDHERGPVGQ